ncbi:MAG: 3-isopropylmalate dehydratase small subunit, partial [Pseudomonadota bacterium]
MDKFTTLTGVAAPMNMINIDTDMIIPKKYLKTIKRTGLGSALFAEIRYDEQGNDKPDFILNQDGYKDAKILVAGQNFGCGSSREHAPWALLDYGIRSIIAPSFADIFFNNTFKNGILPIKLPEARVNELLRFLLELPGAEITIDLPNQTVQGPDGKTDNFDV